MAWWQTIDKQPDSAQFTFPQEFELIPGKLKATVHLKAAEPEARLPNQWIYTSEGLWQAGQKEVYFALRQDDGINPLDFPQAPLQLFKTIHEHAEQEEYVDFGSITEFSCAGFIDQNWKAMAYLEPMPNEQSYFKVPAVSAILLNDLELRTASQFGLTRVIALLGEHFNHYPCPRWSYLKRESPLNETSLNLMKAARTAEIPRLLLLEAAIYRERAVTVLEIPQSAGSKLKTLLQRPSSEPIMFITSYDLYSDACLVWQAEPGNGPRAIAAPGSSGSRLTANSLSIIRQDGESASSTEEDGFLLGINKNSWYELRDALTQNTAFNLVSESGKLLFSLKWSSFNRYRSSSKNLNHTNSNLACGQTNGSSASDHSTAETGGINLKALNLLNNETELKERVNAEEVASYLRQCYQLIESTIQASDHIATGTLKVLLRFSEHAGPLAELSEMALSVPLPENLTVSLGQKLAKQAGPRTKEGTISFEMLIDLK